jgi:hypothetical protein
MVHGVFMSAFEGYGGDRSQLDHNLSDTQQLREMIVSPEAISGTEQNSSGGDRISLRKTVSFESVYSVR